MGVKEGIMEIKVGNIKLTAKDGCGHPYGRTIITIDVSQDPDNHVFDVDSEELAAAIEALERACWRP